MTEFPSSSGTSTPAHTQFVNAEVIATLAHDLRSPLASIRTGIEVLKLSLQNPAQIEKVIGMLERQTAEMTGMVDGMLTKNLLRTASEALSVMPSPEIEPSASDSYDTVLVVDDSPSAVEILSLFFRMEGLEVSTAHLGEDAIALAKEMEPCVVFLDLGLPDISGYEVAEQIRNMPNGDKFYIVALTGRNEEEDRIKIKQAGFDVHVVKPPAPAMLREVLQTAIKKD